MKKRKTSKTSESSPSKKSKTSETRTYLVVSQTSLVLSSVSTENAPDRQKTQKPNSRQQKKRNNNKKRKYGQRKKTRRPSSKRRRNSIRKRRKMRMIGKTKRGHQNRLEGKSTGHKQTLMRGTKKNDRRGRRSSGKRRSDKTKLVHKRQSGSRALCQIRSNNSRSKAACTSSDEQHGDLERKSSSTGSGKLTVEQVSIKVPPKPANRRQTCRSKSRKSQRQMSKRCSRRSSGRKTSITPKRQRRNPKRKLSLHSKESTVSKKSLPKRATKRRGRPSRKRTRGSTTPSRKTTMISAKRRRTTQKQKLSLQNKGKWQMAICPRCQCQMKLVPVDKSPSPPRRKTKRPNTNRRRKNNPRKRKQGGDPRGKKDDENDPKEPNSGNNESNKSTSSHGPVQQNSPGDSSPSCVSKKLEDPNNRSDPQGNKTEGKHSGEYELVISGPPSGEDVTEGTFHPTEEQTGLLNEAARAMIFIGLAILSFFDPVKCLF